jgi:YaiO family outer membrane protein
MMQMSKLGVSIFVLGLAFQVSNAWAQEVGREAQVKEARPVWTAGRNIWRFDPSFEYSWIKQGGRKIRWKMFSQRLTYILQKDIMPFVEMREYERASVKDYVADIGLDTRTEDSYSHAELGFGGTEIDYVYKFKSFLEYARRLKGTVFLKIGQEFLHYAANNVSVFSPGIVYYFGDNYVMWDYNVSITTHRDPAQWTTLKGSLRCMKALDAWGGVAIGERLYDILSLGSTKQYSYIFFSGLTWRLTEDVSVRLGGSYSQEKPSFIKRSIDAGVSIRF